jgi:hypothetical protein
MQNPSIASFQHGVLESRLTWMSPDASLRTWMPAIHADMTKNFHFHVLRATPRSCFAPSKMIQSRFPAGDQPFDRAAQGRPVAPDVGKHGGLPHRHFFFQFPCSSWIHQPGRAWSIQLFAKMRLIFGTASAEKLLALAIST